jgi:hypothetical protein
MVKTQTEKLLILFLGVLIFAASVVFIMTQQSVSWDFRNNLWRPAHLLVSGHSPYKIWEFFPKEDTNAIWMPTIIGALFPFGYLPETQATNLWFVMTLVAVMALFAMSIHVEQPSPLLVGVGLLMVLLFLPLIRNLVSGQFSIFAGLLLLLAAKVPNRPFLLALLVVLAATKPQLIVLP